MTNLLPNGKPAKLKLTNYREVPTPDLTQGQGLKAFEALLQDGWFDAHHDILASLLEEIDPNAPTQVQRLASVALREQTADALTDELLQNLARKLNPATFSLGSDLDIERITALGASGILRCEPAKSLTRHLIEDLKVEDIHAKLIRTFGHPFAGDRDRSYGKIISALAALDAAAVRPTIFSEIISGFPLNASDSLNVATLNQLAIDIGEGASQGIISLTDADRQFFIDTADRLHGDDRTLLLELTIGCGVLRGDAGRIDQATAKVEAVKGRTFVR